MQKRITLIAPLNSPDPDIVQCQPPLQTLLQTYKVKFDDLNIEPGYLVQCQPPVQIFYKHRGNAKKVANRVLRTMLGNLFIEVGYLGPLGQNAPFVTSNPKIWPPNTELKKLFAIFLEHLVYTAVELARQMR